MVFDSEPTDYDNARDDLRLSLDAKLRYDYTYFEYLST